MSTVTCPKCGLRVRAEDGECFACGARLPRPRIEPEEYYEPTPRQAPQRQQPDYQQIEYKQAYVAPNYNNAGAYQSTQTTGAGGYRREACLRVKALSHIAVRHIQETHYLRHPQLLLLP